MQANGWIEEKVARELVAGDVFLNHGARVEFVHPSHHGAKVYIVAVWDEDGERRTFTVDADTPAPVWHEG
jgi:hypothetical protein